MAKKIVIPLNQVQKEKIKKKFGRVCDNIEVDKDDLINLIKYMPPKICIDFDEKQEQVIKKNFPDNECDFALIDISNLGTIVRYMSPR
jgi:hypothetical protein